MTQLSEIVTKDMPLCLIMSTINDRMLTIRQETQHDIDDEVDKFGSGFLTDIIFAEGFFSEVIVHRVMTDKLAAAETEYHQALLARYIALGYAPENTFGLYRTKTYRQGSSLAMAVAS